MSISYMLHNYTLFYVHVHCNTARINHSYNGVSSTCLSLVQFCNVIMRAFSPSIRKSGGLVPCSSCTIANDSIMHVHCIIINVTSIA